MANNVQIQLQRSKEMKAKVQEFAATLTREMDDLKETLYESVRAGFPEDIAETYRVSCYEPDHDIINALSNEMRNRHVDFLDRIIADLEGAIS